MTTKIDNIRNLTIVHIDHGKSTIADRIIHKWRLTDREMKAQVLDLWI